MGGQAIKQPPPVNIPKPILQMAPDAIQVQAFNPEAYSAASRESAQRAYNLQAEVAKFQNQKRSQVEAENSEKMNQYNQQVAAAEAQRQMDIIAQKQQMQQMFQRQNPNVQRQKYPQQPSR